MEIITMILSGLALLAAILCLILILREKKRNQKRNAALTDLLRRDYDSAFGYIGEYGRGGAEEHAKILASLNEIADVLQSLAPAMKEAASALGDYKGRIEDLENGIVPDYNEALKAKESVDRFNEGVSGILGFNPMEAAKKSRQERTYGGEVE